MKNAKLAVIYEDSIYHEGDERSRTHPGHGYPAYTETVRTFKEFKDETELKEWITRNENKRFKVIRYEELEVKKEITISLS